MKAADLRSYVVSSIAAAVLAACGGSPGYAPVGPIPLGHESGLTLLSIQRVAALTMPHYERHAAHPDHRASWMRPGTSSQDLLYVGDWGTNDVYVYSYPSLTAVGTLTGFDDPYGMCIDKKGDVYVANFGSGTTVEYAHGGTMPINTFTTTGYAIGCSIGPRGDVAVTDFYTASGAGQVCVWRGASGSSTCYSDPDVCYYLWTFGYDRKGDLVGGGEYDGITFCGIPGGGKAMIQFNDPYSTRGLFPAGTSWDGKYLVLGNQEANGYTLGLQRAKLEGTTLIFVGNQIVLSDDCYSDYVDDVNPFLFGKKNVTPATRNRAGGVVGPNVWCYDEGKPAVDVWKYPAGGDPSMRLTSGLTEPYGAAISVAK